MENKNHRRGNAMKKHTLAGKSAPKKKFFQLTRNIWTVTPFIDLINGDDGFYFKEIGYDYDWGKEMKSHSAYRKSKETYKTFEEAEKAYLTGKVEWSEWIRLN